MWLEVVAEANALDPFINRLVPLIFNFCPSLSFSSLIDYITSYIYKTGYDTAHNLIIY